MILLSVSFAEKDQVKALGARWSADKRSWYIPDHLSDDAKKEEDQRLMRREIVSPLLDENERKEEKIERTQEEEEKIDWKARRELIFARNY